MCNTNELLIRLLFVLCWIALGCLPGVQAQTAYQCYVDRYAPCLDLDGQCTTSFANCADQCNYDSQCTTNCCLKGYCSYSSNCTPDLELLVTIIIPVIFGTLFILLITYCVLRFCRKKRVENFHQQQQPNSMSRVHAHGYNFNNHHPQQAGMMAQDSQQPIENMNSVMHIQAQMAQNMGMRFNNQVYGNPVVVGNPISDTNQMNVGFYQPIYAQPRIPQIQEVSLLPGADQQPSAYQAAKGEI